MAVFEWDNKYSVDIFLMDGHHKKLFSILNKIYELMAQGADDEGIIKIIAELLDYTHYHFREEEEMMEKIGYPDIVNHKREHERFVAKVTEFHTSAKNGMAIFVAVKVANVGVDWLKQHILTVDAKYDKYIKDHNLTV